METLWDKVKWRVGKWIWSPPGEMPVTDPKDSRWVEPSVLYREGSLPGKTHRSRGAKAEFHPEIRPIPQRGGEIRRQFRDRAPHKAKMSYVGKGSKTGRRD